MMKTEKKTFTSDRWANRMQCRIFEGAEMDILQGEINEWLEAQEYVKVLTSKSTSVGEVIVITIFYAKITKLDKEYNVK